jgi:hypothetical protein
VFDCAKGFEGIKPAAKDAPRGSDHALPVVRHFPVREFPQVSVHGSGGSLAHKEPGSTLNDEGYEVFRCHGAGTAQVRQFLDAALAAGKTMPGDRTDLAFRLARGADQRAQFHQRLVEMGAGMEDVMRDA